jgi:hypothetical protein
MPTSSAPWPSRRPRGGGRSCRPVVREAWGVIRTGSSSSSRPYTPVSTALSGSKRSRPGSAPLPSLWASASQRDYQRRNPYISPVVPERESARSSAFTASFRGASRDTSLGSFKLQKKLHRLHEKRVAELAALKLERIRKIAERKELERRQVEQSLFRIRARRRASIEIQRLWRGHAVRERKRRLALARRDYAARVVFGFMRVAVARKQLHALRLQSHHRALREQAALCIQRGWRRSVSREEGRVLLARMRFCQREMLMKVLRCEKATTMQAHIRGWYVCVPVNGRVRSINSIHILPGLPDSEFEGCGFSTSNVRHSCGEGAMDRHPHPSLVERHHVPLPLGVWSRDRKLGMISLLHLRLNCDQV